MKKKILAMFMAASLCLGLTACSTVNSESTSASTTPETTSAASAVDSTASSETSSPTKEKFKIGYVSAAFSDEYCKRLADAFVACSNAEIEVTALDGNLDVANIITCIETFKAQGVDAVIIQPLGNTPDACIWANEEGVPLIFVNIMPQLSDSTNDLQYYYVGSSEQAIGAQQARDLAEGLDQGSKVCLLMLPLGQDNQIGRTQGFEEWMTENRPDIEIIDKQAVTKTDAAEAMSITEDWIQRFGIDGIDAIASQGSTMTIGIIESIKAHDATGKILISGISIPPEGLDEWIGSGLVYCDLYQNPMSEASAAVDAAYKLLTGKENEIKADDNNVVWVDMMTVNTKTLEEVKASALY